jgi:hypothetical protein
VADIQSRIDPDDAARLAALLNRKGLDVTVEDVERARERVHAGLIDPHEW